MCWLQAFGRRPRRTGPVDGLRGLVLFADLGNEGKKGDGDVPLPNPAVFGITNSAHLADDLRTGSIWK